MEFRVGAWDSNPCHKPSTQQNVKRRRGSQGFRSPGCAGRRDWYRPGKLGFNFISQLTSKFSYFLFQGRASLNSLFVSFWVKGFSVSGVWIFVRVSSAGLYIRSL